MDFPFQDLITQFTCFNNTMQVFGKISPIIYDSWQILH
jgi:hypothetical protein